MYVCVAPQGPRTPAAWVILPFLKYHERQACPGHVEDVLATVSNSGNNVHDIHADGLT